MAPVATTDKPQDAQPTVADLKASLKSPAFDPYYLDIDDDAGYAYNDFKKTFPDIRWDPIPDLEVTERALAADPEKKSLLAAATKVKQLTPAIGVELEGIDLRQLSDTQKDELALLIAERGVVFFRNQPINVYEQLDLGRYWGPLHRHPTSGQPVDPKLDEVHVVYADKFARPNTELRAKYGWHSDVSYEKQTPSYTSLKGICIPETGGDTAWSSGYALYSSLSPNMQKYLEGLSAVHSAVAQADGARASGKPVRRQEIETIHPIVRVHPATGYKSIYVNSGFTRRIVGVPKVESDTILKFLFDQIAQNPDLQVRLKWETDTVAIWDNRIVTHTAIKDHWPIRRHALRVTPQGEKPLSVAAYEQTTGKVAKDWQLEVWKSQGINVNGAIGNGAGPKGYND